MQMHPIPFDEKFTDEKVYRQIAYRLQPAKYYAHDILFVFQRESIIPAYIF